MGREIQFVDSLKEFGTLYKNKLDENQLYIAEELRRRDIIKLVKLKDGTSGYRLYATNKPI
tara:strand:- start:42 stop:224 length:183 start_codon:yes stop_codon:yes gene_type:complete